MSLSRGLARFHKTCLGLAKAQASVGVQHLKRGTDGRIARLRTPTHHCTTWHDAALVVCSQPRAGLQLLLLPIALCATRRQTPRASKIAALPADEANHLPACTDCSA